MMLAFPLGAFQSSTYLFKPHTCSDYRCWCDSDSPSRERLPCGTAKSLFLRKKALSDPAPHRATVKLSMPLLPAGSLKAQLYVSGLMSFTNTVSRGGCGIAAAENS